MTISRIVTSIVVVTLTASIALAGSDTTFTYQGRLLDTGEPANGLFDFEFGLWDAADDGNPIGVPQVLDNTSVTDGVFTVQLDFGAEAFDDADRWLEIVVDATTLSPRQPITRAPYAIQTRGIVMDDDQHAGMGITPGTARLRVWNLAGNAFDVVSSSRAVEAISTNGDMAILGSNQSADGLGVFGQNQPSGNQGWLGSPDYGVFSSGDYGGTGAKYFIQPHPHDPSKEIRFVCLEGNESGTYFRGSTQLVDGRAVINVPEEFRLVTEADGLTVQVTAKGPNGGLWVETEALDKIVVRGNGNVQFNYFVNGVRRGFADHEPIRANHAYVPQTRGVPYGTQYREGHRRLLVENGILNPDFTPNEETAARVGWTLSDPD